MTEPDDLYGLPLDRFISERDALVKALRKDGERERAKEVSSLRKPSVAGWAVNQLVRTRRDEVAALFEAGDALQQAQAQLLAGRGDGRALRESVARERDAVDALSKQARGLLSSEGHELTQATLEHVTDTLHAAALDPDARERVQPGCLERELRHVGLGELGALGAQAPKTRRRGKDKRPTNDKKAVEESKRAERERAEKLKAARKAEADARRGAERAERDLSTAQERRDDALAALQEAARELERLSGDATGSSNPRAGARSRRPPS